MWISILVATLTYQGTCVIIEHFLVRGLIQGQRIKRFLSPILQIFHFPGKEGFQPINPCIGHDNIICEYLIKIKNTLDSASVHNNVCKCSCLKSWMVCECVSDFNIYNTGTLYVAQDTFICGSISTWLNQTSTVALKFDNYICIKELLKDLSYIYSFCII